MWKPCEFFKDVKHPVKYPVKQNMDFRKFIGHNSSLDLRALNLSQYFAQDYMYILRKRILHLYLKKFSVVWIMKYLHRMYLVDFEET